MKEESRGPRGHLRLATRDQRQGGLGTANIKHFPDVSERDDLLGGSEQARKRILSRSTLFTRPARRQTLPFERPKQHVRPHPSLTSSCPSRRAGQSLFVVAPGERKVDCVEKARTRTRSGQRHRTKAGRSGESRSGDYCGRERTGWLDQPKRRSTSVAVTCMHQHCAHFTQRRIKSSVVYQW